jgi:hypothetical protein
MHGKEKFETLLQNKITQIYDETTSVCTVENEIEYRLNIAWMVLRKKNKKKQ